jgi:hypothetical protein
MAFNPFTVIKSLLIKQEGTSTPTQVEIIPGGTASTKTTIQASQTTNKTLTLPDATDTLIGKATTDVLTNKSIDADGTGNVITNIDDGNIKAAAAIDATKIADGSVSNTEFQLLNGLSSGIVTLDGVQTLTNKTLTAPVVNSPTGIVKADVGLSNVDNTSDATKNATVATLTNKTLTSPVINSPTGLVKADVGLSNVDNTSDATKNAAAVTLQNKIIDNTNVITVTDTGLTIQDSGDVTKQLQLDAGSITPGALRVLTAPNANTTIVGTDVAQVLTLKDIDGGNASNTSRVTLPKAARTTLDALTRKQGTIVHDTTTNKPLFDDGTNLQPFGTGAGNINLISNGDGEAGITGWAYYTDAAAPRPVDGAGGGQANLTLSTTTTNPLNGSNSFLLSKIAGNAQGQGVSYDFSIPLEFRAKALTVKVPYILVNGTFVAGTPTTDSDFIIYFYDITNSKLVEPSSFKFLSNSTTVSDAVQATVQFDSNCTSGRFIIHRATTASGILDIKLDDISVGPANYQYGTPVTDTISYTPTGTITTNATLTGRARRVGDCAETNVTMVFSGTNTQAIDWSFTSAQLFNGLGWVIDDTKLPAAAAANDFVSIGVGGYEDAGTAIRGGLTVWYQKSTSLVKIAGSSFSDLTPSSNTPITIASGDSFSFTCKVPILGWSSSVQTSDQTDTRVVAFRAAASGQTPQSLSSTTAWTITSQEDTHGGFTGTTSYTIKVPGYYDLRFVADAGVVTTGSVNNLLQNYIMKNGVALFTGLARSQVSAALNNFQIVSGGIALLVIGDVITVNLNTNFSTPGTTGSGVLSISRISGPSAIAANETIACNYTSSSGQSIANVTDVNLIYGTKVYDSHGAFNPATGIFTSPRAGKYRVSGGYSLSGLTINTGEVLLTLFKNGTSSRRLFRSGVGPSSVMSAFGSVTIDLLAGEMVNLKAYQGNGATRSCEAIDASNWISIESVAN